MSEQVEVVLRTLATKDGIPFPPPVFAVPMEYFHLGLERYPLIRAGASLRHLNPMEKAAEITQKQEFGTTCLFQFPDPSRMKENERLTAKILEATPNNTLDYSGLLQPGIFLVCELDRPTFDILFAFRYVLSQKF